MENFIGILLPPLIEVVNKDVQNEEARFIVGCVVCFMVSILVNFQKVQNGDFSTLPQTFLVILTEAVSVFNLYWRKSFLRNKLQEKLGTQSTQ